MALTENLSRLILAIDENPNYDTEEIQELILDTPEDEIRNSGNQFVILSHKLTEALVKTKRSVAGIHMLSNAVVKLQSHSTQLTPIHSDLCLLCLDSKCLNPALRFLETVYTDIKRSDENDEDTKNVMLFFYYGGLIYAAIKNFERASYFFEVVLTMPANVMSPLMQETYKKQIILNLLLHGKVLDNMLPKYASNCVFRQRRQIGNSYLKLAQEFTSLNYEKIRRIISINSMTYERDENVGLIKQCLTQVHKRNIKRLTKTFLTLSLRDVAEHVGLASDREAEMYIVNMIDDGEIFASINQKDGMVVFQDSSENFDTVTVFHKLQEDMNVTTNLINILKKMDSQTTIDAKNHSKLNPDIQ